MAIRYEAGSLRIGQGRVGRALIALNVVVGAVAVGLGLAGELSWWVAGVFATNAIPLVLLDPQLRLDERGIHWRPARFASVPRLSGLRERPLAWADVLDVDIDYPQCRIALTTREGPVALEGLRLPDPEPDRDLLESFVARHLEASAWQRERTRQSA